MITPTTPHPIKIKFLLQAQHLYSFHHSLQNKFIIKCYLLSHIFPSTACEEGSLYNLKVVKNGHYYYDQRPVEC